MVKNPLSNVGDVRDVGSIPGSGRSPGEGNVNSLQYSRLENPLDRGVRQFMVQRVAQSLTRLEPLSTQHVSYSFACATQKMLISYLLRSMTLENMKK